MTDTTRDPHPMLKYGERSRAWSRGETALHFGLGPDRFRALIHARDVSTIDEAAEMVLRSRGDIMAGDIHEWESRNIE